MNLNHRCLGIKLTKFICRLATQLFIKYPRRIKVQISLESYGYTSRKNKSTTWKVAPRSREFLLYSKATSPENVPRRNEGCLKFREGGLQHTGIGVAVSTGAVRSRMDSIRRGVRDMLQRAYHHHISCHTRITVITELVQGIRRSVISESLLFNFRP